MNLDAKYVTGEATQSLLGGLVLAGAVFRAVRPAPLVPVLLLVAVGAAALIGASRLRRGPVCGPGTPGMAPYDGGPTRVAIRNLSPAGPVMTFDVVVAPPPPRD